MFNWTDTQIEKGVLWAAKGATMIVSAPSTLYVVTLFYKSDSKFVQILVQIAALFVIEGAFLYSWQRLENKKKVYSQDSDEIRPYVFGVWFMYLMLIGVGFLHGEGLAALFLRASIGLLLYYGTHDTWSKITKRDDNDLVAGDKLSKKAVKAAKAANEEVQLAIIQADKEARLEALNESVGMVAEIAADKVMGILRRQSRATVRLSENKPANSAKFDANLMQFANNYDNVKGDHFENDVYSVAKNGSGFNVECKLCDKKEHRDTYISAVRWGAAHSRNHPVIVSEN